MCANWLLQRVGGEGTLYQRARGKEIKNRGWKEDAGDSQRASSCNKSQSGGFVSGEPAEPSGSNPSLRDVHVSWGHKGARTLGRGALVFSPS